MIFLPLILCWAAAIFGADSLSSPGAAIPGEAADTALIIEREAPEEAPDEGVKTGSPAAEAQQEKLHLKSGDEMGKSVSRKSAFLSLLIPGLGEYRSGYPKLGKSAMILDGLLWIGLGSAFYLRSQTRNDLRAYLFTHGAADGRHGDSRKTAWDLNDDELQLPLYADSSAFYEERVYAPMRGTDPSLLKIDFFWQWESEAAHQRYYDLWTSANQAKVVGYYFLGTAVVLRAASFINANRLLKKASMDHAAYFDVFPALVGRGSPGLTVAARF